MRIAEAIKVVIKNNGIDIFNSPQKFQSMVMDYGNECEQEQNLFCICCQQNILNFAKKIITLKDEVEIENLAKKEKIRLEHDTFMCEKYIVEGINMFLKGLGVKFELKEEYINEKSKVVESVQKIQNGLETLFYDKKVKIDENLFQDLNDAADTGDRNALIYLGDCYKCGIGVKENWRIAKYYYHKAVELGSREAKYKLIELINTHKV